MTCEFCGHENEPGVKFCVNCGAQLAAAPAGAATVSDFRSAVPEVPIQNGDGFTSKLKALPLKKILLIAAPIIVIAIVLIIIFSSGGSGGSVGGTVSTGMSIFTDSDTTYVSYNNNDIIKITGSVYNYQRSLDGSKAAILTDYTNYASGGTLWIVNSSGAARIAEGVFAFQIADSGNGILYASDYVYMDDVASLYLYDASAKKAVRITDEAVFHGDSLYGTCISPDGKTVGYIVDEEPTVRAGFIKSDGKPAAKFGDNMFAVAISNGEKFIYYIKTTSDGYEASLNVKSGKNDNRLIPSTDIYSISLMLNEDYSQAMFNMNGNAYISRNGGEREKLTNAGVSGIVLPRGSQQNTVYSYISSYSVYGIKTFSGITLRTSEGLTYIAAGLESRKISGSANGVSLSPVLTSDGKKLIYQTASGSLVSINPAKPDAERVDIAKNVKSFTAASDGKIIYYVNSEDELWVIDSKGKPTKIADDVYSGISLSYSGNRLFFLTDYKTRTGGDLYYSDNGGKKTKVTGGSDVMRVWNNATSTFYMTTDSEAYRSRGDEKFSKFQQDVNVIAY